MNGRPSMTSIQQNSPVDKSPDPCADPLEPAQAPTEDNTCAEFALTEGLSGLTGASEAKAGVTVAEGARR